MALPWLQRFELLLFTAAFLCGAVAAATLTRTQVRGGAGPAWVSGRWGGMQVLLSGPARSRRAALRSR